MNRVRASLRALRINLLKAIGFEFLHSFFQHRPILESWKVLRLRLTSKLLNGLRSKPLGLIRVPELLRQT